ncbi:glutamine amidotransferase [Fibrobacter intestinalis]|uniref:Imidazole glycerol phosphate synthase subunit HisH n=1 Tax=Fibrobacter intestinalis TaxID=28122 RepID=A0A1M6Z7G3_9BACT|nr:imidazole glycerol phosphate synthase subunit HisH [Fibrobacter intestinalis]MDD7299121.1 imidazole glycerol phosphate synthase subunit HisH [Fibrobacter intestinalis]SHL26342.1 glutamine amidotransferase [Fibrobacter intestinalis]
MERFIVVDYDAGNLTSVLNAFAHLGVAVKASRDPKEIAEADRLVFPGVGAAKSSMETLEKSGIGKAISQVVARKCPVLGICIGCQIILESSEEDGGVNTLGLIGGKAVRFREEAGIKIPHMGWNQVHFLRRHPIFDGIPDDSDFYFVHSFHPDEIRAENALAETTYGSQKFVSALGCENLVATQFHLEKSGDVGLQVLKNFSAWSGVC